MKLFSWISFRRFVSTFCLVGDRCLVVLGDKFMLHKLLAGII